MAFDPQDGEAAGKQIRKFTLRQAGFGPHAVDVHCTLWPEYDSVGLAQGDAVTVEGKYTSRNGQTKDGGERTYHNLSVSRIKNFGPTFSGQAPAVENAVSDDDIPF